ncbi:hypothetical protein D3C78_1184200 [compost metagenome]
MQLIDALAQGRRIERQDAGDVGDFLVGLRQEFVQRRVEQADRHRQAVHDLEQFGEIRTLHRQKLVERCPPALFTFRKDHLTHHMDAVALEEHMFGAAQPNTLSAKGAGGAGVSRRIGIGAHRHAAQAIGPLHQLAEIT